MEFTATMRQQVADQWVITACKAGDRDAFRVLFETYQDTVYRTALYFLDGNTAAAEDVSQEVFVRLFDRIGQFRSESDFSTWLHRVVINTCIDEQRRQKKVAPLDEADRCPAGTSGSDPHRFAEQQEMVDAVQSAVGGLSPPLRAAVVLKYFGDLSYDEMAAALHCSPGTVASRLNRGLKTLGRRLAPFRDRIQG